MSDWQRRTAAALRDQLTLMGQRQLPSNRDGFDEEFDSLRALDHRVRTNHDEFYTASLGSNMSKNRYREILPNEGTRVQLDPINNRGDGDYINANYVDGRRLFGAPFVYIATQAPLRSSIGDFWRMVFENQVSIIVMLCAEIENGKVKSERYWPEGIGGVLTVGPLTITLVAENHRHDSIFRNLQVRTADGAERELYHLQYVRWPDQGIPQTSAPLMEIIRTLGSMNASVKTPIVVHCSGGVGRTGVFIGLHVALALFQIEQPLSVPKIVQYLKFCRSGMVQRKDQYLFLYFAILREMEKMIWSIESARHAHGMASRVSAPPPPQAIEARQPANEPTPSEDDQPSFVSRRPPQHVPQHPYQSTGSLKNLESNVSNAVPRNRNTDTFAPTSLGNGFDRSGSASLQPLTGGKPSDIEMALRSMQQRSQSFRQTPSQARSLRSQTVAPEVNASLQPLRPYGTVSESQQQRADSERQLSSVAARLPLERRQGEQDSYALPSPVQRMESSKLPPQASASRPVPLSESRQNELLLNVRRLSVGPMNDDMEPEPRASDNQQSYFFSTASPFASPSQPPPAQQAGSRDRERLRPEPIQTTSDLEAASRNFNASILGGPTITQSRVGKSDVNLL